MAKQRTILNLHGSRGAPPVPGEVQVAGYRVEALLGSGPVTAVYRALLESHQQAVALKVLLPHLAGSEAFVQRFLQAANTARLVIHDRVLPCYDVGQSNGWVYLANELIDGPSLAQATSEGPLDRSRTVYLAWQIATGIEAIHAAGLVHANLRPTSILLDDEDGVRLTDLGLPLLQDGEQPSALAGPHLLHLPPEAFPDGAEDPTADTYAIGVVILGALMGRTPWSGCSRQRLSEHHAAGHPVLSEAPAGLLDPDLHAVVARATALRPEDRYAQAFQLREDLERLQYGFAPIHARAPEPLTGGMSRESGARSTRGMQMPAPKMETPPAPRKLGVMAAIGIGIAVVLGAIVMLSSGSDNAPSAPLTTAAVNPTPAPQATAAPATPEEPRPSWAAASGRDVHGRWCTLVVAGVTQRLRHIEPGTYLRGVTPEETHQVTLTSPIWLGETEVTQAFYTAVTGANPSHFRGDNLPVESVNWHAAQDFVGRLSTLARAPVRLPTEAEWEYACRAGSDQAPIPRPELAWTAATNVSMPQPVGQLPPNAWGLHDMQGNVMEWTLDAYTSYPTGPVSDPVATHGIYRVTRGGAWSLDAAAARANVRGKTLPTTQFFYLGLRLAVDD